MRDWIFLLGGLLVWTVHFFGLYGIAEIFGATPGGRLAVFGLTGLCLIADAILWVLAGRLRVADSFTRWLRSVARLGAALSLIAVVWQALPALL